MESKDKLKETDTKNCTWGYLGIIVIGIFILGIFY